LQAKFWRQAATRRLKIRGFGCAAHDMKQRHGAGRSGGGAQRLQIIFARPGRQADDHWNKAAAAPPDRMADGHREAFSIPSFWYRDDLDQSSRGSIFCQVQAYAGARPVMAQQRSIKSP
jgi:hypothetical protein